MNKEIAHNELVKASIKRENARQECKEIEKQYIYAGHTQDGKPIPYPPKGLDSEGMKKILEANKKMELAQKEFKQALNKYYESCKK